MGGKGETVECICILPRIQHESIRFECTAENILYIRIIWKLYAYITLHNNNTYFPNYYSIRFGFRVVSSV